MALNLSTLTNSATSGGILAEALTTADFLDPVPILKNLARGSQKGGDAKQTTALNQPKALPLDANGKGYCYLPATTGNAPAVTFPTIGASDDFVLEMDVYLVDVNNFHIVSGVHTPYRIIVYNNGTQFQFNLNSGNTGTLTSPLNAGASTITCERTNGTFVIKQDGVTKGTIANASGNGNFSHLSFNGQYGTGVAPLNGYIQKATLSIGGTEQLNIDFTATNVRHGDTKIKCATGQIVTINQDSSSSNDVATIIKRPVLRFDGVNDGFKGLFDQTINGGYMFAAFSVLGTGGEAWGRILSVNKTGGLNDYTGSGMVFSYRSGSTNNLATYKSYLSEHVGLFDSSNKDILSESKATQSATLSRVNNADEKTTNNSYTIEGDEFNIGGDHNGGNNPSIDLEYLALFPASITDDQADDVRNFINNRNNVFSLVDNSYYFFDPQKASFTGNFTGSTGSNTLDGYITGSDLGDTDVRSNLTLEQSTLNDQPSTDGYTITFNDSAEHLEFENAASQPLAGWQVVGTSLGTFAYKVNANAVTELSLLGNRGLASFQPTGDSYGIILLPESATGADIEAARKLLIDRGAADSLQSIVIFGWWLQRSDIEELKDIDFSSVTNMGAGFKQSGLTSFNSVDLSSSTNFSETWRNCSSLNSIAEIDASSGTTFANAWNGTSALTSFPAGAKLGTSASNVTFSNAWRSSGLTSFSTPLPTATSLYAAWKNCASLTDFSADVFANWNPSSLISTMFHETWFGCASLTAQSVENILTSIDASNQHGTDDGTSTGNPLGDSGIDIDYDGTTLSAATNTAVDSLKSKGWSIVVNGVTL